MMMSQRLWNTIAALVRLDTAVLLVITVVLFVALAGR
jgi:hypothetical protein